MEKKKRTKSTPGPKPEKNSRVLSISFKVTVQEKNRLNGMAKIYSAGDRSEYIRMRCFEYSDPVRKVLKEKTA